METPEPDLAGLTSRLGEALQKFQFEYRSEVARSNGQDSPVNDFEEATAEAVWNTFRETMTNALDDESLHLNADFGPPREDGSIFISISSYRDPSCSATVQKAYERAAYPDLVNVGVVQQNCDLQSGCFTGVGWGATRQWIPQKGPDPDCMERFCASSFGRSHCAAGRARILRISESEAFGPYFSRYLNAKMWRGEEYFLQIDAHTDFRTGWDESLRDMISKTPSYPYSVISNYPPSGRADDKAAWPKLKDGRWKNREALCWSTFERAGGNSYTLRMQRVNVKRAEEAESDIPPYAAFVAAGFFFAHGSIVELVPPDPFLPYIFMGEEIALSTRLWTAGFDIYSPSADVLRHEYVRKDGPKFWESVGMVFSQPGFHNGLQDLVLRRVQHLIGLRDHEYGNLEEQKLLTRFDDYAIGKFRSLEDYHQTMGLDMARKAQTPPAWCRRGQAPPIVRISTEKEL